MEGKIKRKAERDSKTPFMKQIIKDMRRTISKN